MLLSRGSNPVGVCPVTGSTSRSLYVEKSPGSDTVTVRTSPVVDVLSARIPRTRSPPSTTTWVLPSLVPPVGTSPASPGSGCRKCSSSPVWPGCTSR